MSNPVKYQRNLVKRLFLPVCFIPFILLPLLSLSAGISGDEPVHHEHAEMVYNYFASEGGDQSALQTPETFLRYYGQSADDLAYRITRWIRSDNPYLVRHLLIALFGAMAIFFAAQIALLLAGHSAGILTVILLLLSPSFLGHSLNNMKDIPFAMGYLMTIFSLLAFIRALPKIKLAAVAGMLFGTAISLSVRAGGLLLFPIILFFGSIGAWMSQPEQNRKFYYLKISIILIGIVVLGWGLGILDWPYARLKPVSNTIHALARMTHYNVSLRQLFDGEMLWSDSIPWFYVPKYFLITTPALILLGLLLATIQIRPKSLVFKQLNIGIWQWVMILFCALFPVFWVIVQRSNLYGGIRHLLFVYPLLAVIAATGWSALWRKNYPKWIVYLSWFIFGTACAGPLVHIFRNHPVEYVYFNKLSGGIKKAWGHYETDYYYHSLGPAVKWIEREILRTDPDEEITLASSFPLEPFFLRSENQPKLVYVPFNQRNMKDWDYGIFAAAYLSPSQLQGDCWPPAGTIHTIRVDGFPVCAIVKRVYNFDTKGITAYSTGNHDEAIRLLRRAIEVERCNLAAYLYLGWSYRKTGQLEASNSVAYQLLQVHSESEPARELLIWNYLDLKDLSKARILAEELFRINPKYPPVDQLLQLTGVRKSSPTS
ncbi:MAG: hypothetical protein PHN30_00880 [Bacteroidales bacterium]|jgi:hypothetical protein|nr:hypothetical protein [Bacteroidales bacterium]MDD2813130.1 hypothetical protein [Bacteroidales bacterium]MDD3384250.1 hypothetical protein [Bacteroidales bacterium]MDD3871427.1 hypothetical protein [Bacteroidales bacterium]MDD4813560.1 hypothetical protein [Bacteroidales bacterium]